MRRLPMGSKSKAFAFHHQHVSCTRIHLAGAVVLVAFTYFLCGFFHWAPSPCSSSSWQPPYGYLSSNGAARFDPAGSLFWPERGFGFHLDLKIYVYDADEIDGLKALMYGRYGNITPHDCVMGQWGTQVKIHRLLLQSKFRTKNKEDADFFFVPTYVKCVHMHGGLTDQEINQTFIKVLSQMPYFRRSGGRDHIFVFPSGNGAHFFNSWETYINRSIFLTPEGDRTDKQNRTSFNTWKDIIIPGNVDEATQDATVIVPLPLLERKYLASYLGRAQGKVGRLQLVELAKRFPTKLEAPDLRLAYNKLEKQDYFEHLRNAKFCLVPRGESSWTLRFFEAFFAECVPVLLSDQIELPFQDVIDYFKLAIKLPTTWIGPQLLDYLESIPDEVVERMIAHGRQVRCLFVYAGENRPCSAMTGIFWELQRKVRLFHQSTETFWLHNGNIVNRNLVSFADWKPPVPLP